MTLRLPYVRHAVTAVLTVAALAVTAIVWARVVHTISTARPADSPLRATSVVWGDRVFPSPSELTRWLHVRGASYAAWSRNHPSAAARLEQRRTATHSRASRAIAATTTASSVAAARSGTKVSPPRSSSSNGFPVETVLVTLLALLAAACVWAATLPTVLRYRFPDLTRWLATRRDFLLASAAALVIGVVAGVALN